MARIAPPFQRFIENRRAVIAIKEISRNFR